MTSALNPNLTTRTLRTDATTPRILSRRAVFLLAFFGGLTATVFALAYNARSRGRVRAMWGTLAIGLTLIIAHHFAWAWVTLDWLEFLEPGGLQVVATENVSRLNSRYLRWSSGAVQLIASVLLMRPHFPMWRLTELLDIPPKPPWLLGLGLLASGRVIQALLNAVTLQLYLLAVYTP